LQVLYTNAPLVVSAPTGSGKTVIFELAVIRLLIQSRMQARSPDFKVVYSNRAISSALFRVNLCAHLR